MKKLSILAAACLMTACSTTPFSLTQEMSQQEALLGTAHNQHNLCVAAGDKLYSIGDQAGRFPEVGFHVQGEMGGIWMHPIKLADGFTMSIQLEGQSTMPLDVCNQFIAHPLGNQFRYDISDALRIVRTDFVPDHSSTLVVAYQLENRGTAPLTLTPAWEVASDLRPVWLGERSGMIDTQDKLVSADKHIVVKDSLNDWYVAYSIDRPMREVRPVAATTKGLCMAMAFEAEAITLKPGETQKVRLSFAGSMQDKAHALQALETTQKKVATLYAEKAARYQKIDQTAAIAIPDSMMQKIYRWGKYNTDWLVRDVDGMGQGISAGLPDYPWFFSNDQAVTFRALLGTRDPELFYSSMAMIKEASDRFNDSSGRIMHELSSNGAVYDKGRMEESQEFIITCWDIYRWTGNKDFLHHYYQHGKQVWQFLQDNDQDNDLFPEGPGGTEIRGLTDEMLDVAVHTCHFLEVMAEMGEALHDTDYAHVMAEKAAVMKEKINRLWWSDTDKRYFDFMSSPEKAVQLIDMALEERVIDGRNEWARKKLTALRKDIKRGTYKEHGYNVFYNASSLTPLVAGIAPADKGREAIEALDYFTNKFGLYIAGIARPDNIHLEEGSVQDRLEGDFNYNEAIMPIATSNLALAACRYEGFPAARRFIKQLETNWCFATPGTSYEVSPDYGMFVQAWNVVGYNRPLIHHLFGISPMAADKAVTVAPQLPEDWPYARLDNLLIGDNKLSVHGKRTEAGQTWIISHTEKDWTTTFAVPSGTKTVLVNGEPATIEQGRITIQAQQATIELK